MRIALTDSNNVPITALLRKEGHICFEFNVADNTVDIAKFEDNDIQIDKVKYKVIKIRENCIYETALNKRNFIKKISKPIKNAN